MLPRVLRSFSAMSDTHQDIQDEAGQNAAPSHVVAVLPGEIVEDDGSPEAVLSGMALARADISPQLAEEITFAAAENTNPVGDASASGATTTTTTTTTTISSPTAPVGTASDSGADGVRAAGSAVLGSEDVSSHSPSNSGSVSSSLSCADDARAREGMDGVDHADELAVATVGGQDQMENVDLKASPAGQGQHSLPQDAAAEKQVSDPEEPSGNAQVRGTAPPPLSPPGEQQQEEGKFLIPVTDLQFWLIFSALMIGLFLASLDSTVISTCIPSIVADLNGQQYISWVVSSYLTSSTAFVALYGKVSDIIGRKTAFISAQIFFLSGSMACALAQNMTQLIVFRAIQGVGGGGLMGLTQIIMADFIRPRDRGKYSGVLGAVFAFSSVVGPLIGGLFSQYVTWRWAFWINLPVGGVALLVTIIFLEVKIKLSSRKLDFSGSLFCIAFVVCLMLALTWSESTYSWSDPLIIALLCISAGLIVLFILNEAFFPEPIVPVRLFVKRAVAVSNVVSSSCGVGLYCAMTYIPIFLQQVQGKTATISGLLMAPMMLSLVAFSMGSGLYMSKTGKYSRFPLAGMALCIVSSFCLTLLTDTFSYGFLAVLLIVLGMGMGFNLQILMVSVQNVVEPRQMASATASVAFMRTLAGAVGVTVFQVLMQDKMSQELKNGTSPMRALADGVGFGFWFVGAMMVLGFLFSIFLPAIPLRGRATSGHGSSAAVRKEDLSRTDGKASHTLSDPEPTILIAE